MIESGEHGGENTPVLIANGCEPVGFRRFSLHGTMHRIERHIKEKRSFRVAVNERAGFPRKRAREVRGLIHRIVAAQERIAGVVRGLLWTQMGDDLGLSGRDIEMSLI